MEKIFFRRVALKSFLICALFFTSAFQLVNAQTSILKGTVTSEDGELLPGASVVVTGTTAGVTTDFDGNFEISVPTNAKTITVSYLGFKTQLVAYLGQKNIKVILKSDNNVLDEVVVVGYGTQRAEDVTGAISKVKLEAIERTSNTTVEQALNGRVAGVNTTTSDGSLGAGISIRIRGGTSINANNEPLYVIDGMPIEVNYDVEAASSAISGPQSSPLANLDPGSIQSIEVLKDASAAAIYGARGANGVVIITTKTGVAGKAKMTFDIRTSLSTVPESRYVGMMNTSQYGTNLINARLYNGGIERELEFPGEARGETYNNLDEYQAIYDRAPDTNWQEEIYQMGIISNYAFGVSGGSDGNLYSVRASYLNNEGTVRNSYFKRYNTTFNFQNKINDKFKIVTVLAPSYSIKKGPTSAGEFNQRNMGSVIKALSRQPDRQVGET
ncbi:MAG: SusC/RagA family TonB-linked outer membrane protein, partial [Bacteroidetes bacterium]|nr:SusC/RagA family TonB-linked outer membrane protein [Bacteroidota bacterium]